MLNGKIKSSLGKISYVLDAYTKARLGLVFVVILLGGFAELVGVSIILPIINLAINPSDIVSNRYCKTIVWLIGTDDAVAVMLTLIAATIAVYIGKNIYLAWMNNVIYRFSTNVQRKMAVRLMRSYMNQPYSFFLDKNSSELIRSVNSDTGNFKEVVINCLNIMTNGIMCLFLMGYLVSTNWKITLIVTVIIIICFALIYLKLNKEVRRLGKENQVLGGRIIQALQEAFKGVKEIKILQRESFFVDNYEKNYSKSAEVGRKANLLGILPKYIIETAVICGILLFLAGVTLLEGNYSAYLGQLSVFAVAAFKLLPSVNAIYAYSNTIIYHKASIDLVYRDIKLADDLDNARKKMKKNTDEPGSVQGDIVVEKVDFKYDQAEYYVLKQIDMVIPRGQSAGIMGKTGGGKTTTVDIILGLLKPQDGRVLVGGKDIAEYYDEWLSRISYIPQTIFLSDATIRENIAFGLPPEKIDDEMVKRAAEEAQLMEFVSTLPGGFDTEIGESGIRLSGGQRQRIGIARALYNDPDVLVLDEATSALDNETEAAVMEAIDHLHGKKTLIIIAHRLSTIRNCDVIYEIKDGKAIRRESVDE